MIVDVRNATPEDVPYIAQLERECFPLPWTEESLMHDIVENKLALVLVATVDGKRAGYADVWRIAGEAQLNNIAVSESARGQHVGQAIMEELISRLKDGGDTELTLEVRPSNEPAVGMYKKLGFVLEGRREGYYLDNGEAALIMKRQL